MQNVVATSESKEWKPRVAGVGSLAKTFIVYRMNS
jgi:hypothetical protein